MRKIGIHAFIFFCVFCDGKNCRSQFATNAETDTKWINMCLIKFAMYLVCYHAAYQHYCIIQEANSSINIVMAS